MAPPPPRFDVLDHPGTLAFAHRGGAAEFPENTMPAFEGALGLGYRYLETDVHATSDGVLVAFHDDVLDRVTDRQGAVGELPWSEVRQARIDGHHPIPLLEDLLAAFPEARFNIDPKHDACVPALAEVLRRTGSVGRVCVGAFDDERLRRLRAMVGPDLCTSLGPRATARLLAAGRGLGRPSFAAGCVQVPPAYRGRPLVTERFVRAAHRSGLQVHVWTIDDRAEMERLLDLGVDGIMTDRPSVLRSTLESRGRWAGADSIPASE